MQLAGALVTLGETERAAHWLRVSIDIASRPGLTRSKFDQEMGHLAQIFLHVRPSKQLLTYEVIYFLHQMPKLPNAVLLEIIRNISRIFEGFGLNLNSEQPDPYFSSPYLPEYVSGMMVTVIAYCFLGDSDIAALFSDRLVAAVGHLGGAYNYLTVHSLYWAARAWLAEGEKKKAEKLLIRARRCKRCEFPIERKIEIVLADTRK